MKRHILVTGGAGFIGSNFIHYWLQKYPQDRIINLDKLTYAGNLKNLNSVADNPNYFFAKGDIANAKLVNKIMIEARIDMVVHFAAETHVDNSIQNPLPFIITNIFGTQVLLNIAHKNKVIRFHHISTDEVFGSLRLGEKNKFNEKTRYDPHSPYAASKAASDHLVRASYYTHGLPITITNCSNNYGPYQHGEKLIPKAIINLLQGKKVPVYGNGLNVRDWLYVEDHCQAIELVLLHGKVGETYCVGGMTEDVSNIDIVKKILRLLGQSESMIELVPDRLGHDKKYAVNWSKIKNELGYSPQFTLEQGLEKTIIWYKDNIN